MFMNQRRFKKLPRKMPLRFSRKAIPRGFCHGIGEGTFYKWKAKFGGLEVSDAKRLTSLEDENARLKKLLAEAMLDNAMLKDVALKK